MTNYGYLLRVLSCSISQTITNALGEMELTSAQGQILGYLARRKQAPCPRDLEESFHLSHPTVSGLLARLEKKEFIALRPDPDDRRCKRVFILPKGQDSNGRIYRTFIENEERIVQGFSDEEKRQFANLLARAIRNMGSEPHIDFIKEETDR